MPDGRTKKPKRIMRPDGRSKKPKKIMRLDEQAAAAAIAAADYASAPAKKRKKKQNKIVWPEKKVPAADYASTGLQKRKRRRRRKEEHNQKEEENQKKEKKQYLVVRHAVRNPAYSLIEVNHTEKTAEHPVPFPNRIAFLDGEFNMSFASVCTDRRSWIVGVGGFPGRVEEGPPCGPSETIVFDCKTAAVAKGPPPTAPKYSPLAFAVGARVYVLTRMPCIWTQPDGPPWFEVLDLSRASCVNGRLINSSWRPLPPPPLFPILDEEELSQLDCAPWTARVESYAVFGRYILLSAAVASCGPRTGTVAFDVSTEEWYSVDREKLPFIGEAIPYGRLFLGRSRSKEFKDLTAYCISVTKTKTGIKRKLSITEVPLTIVLTDDILVMSGKFFSCLGNGVVCATGSMDEGTRRGEETEHDEVYIHLYSPINAEEGEAEAQKGGTVLSSEGSRYSFRLDEPFYQPLLAPTLVAAPCVVI